MMIFRLTPGPRVALVLLMTVLMNTLPTVAYFTAFNATTEAVHPGETISVSFANGSYPQANKQYYAVFGLNPTTTTPGVLGTPFGNGKDLLTDAVPSRIVGSNNATYAFYNLTLPDKLPGINGSDTALLAVAVFQVAGASGEASVQSFNTTLKLAKGVGKADGATGRSARFPLYLSMGGAAMVLLSVLAVV